MKIFGNNISRNPTAGTLRRASPAPHSTVQSSGPLALLFPESAREHRRSAVPTALELYHSQILRALFLLMACALWSGCKSTPPPPKQEASILEGTGRYSVIVLPVFIVRSSSSDADKDKDTPPWYQTDPENVPFEVPERTVRFRDASVPAHSPA